MKKRLLIKHELGFWHPGAAEPDLVKAGILSVERIPPLGCGCCTRPFQVHGNEHVALMDHYNPAGEADNSEQRWGLLGGWNLQRETCTTTRH